MMGQTEQALPSIPQRVEKGICWLEEQGAYDWAEKIVAAVNIAAFDMTEQCHCAVGVSLGSYSDHFTDGSEAVNHGFLAKLGPNGFVPRDDNEWAALEAEWERKAREHAAYRAEILG